MTDPIIPASAASMLALLHDVRQLRPDPLTEGSLRYILEVDRWAGSAGNRQPSAKRLPGVPGRFLLPQRPSRKLPIIPVASHSTSLFT
jgi:hypothetical protein